MFYIIIIEVAMLVLGFIFKLSAFYFLIKHFNKTIELTKILKPILLYEIGAFVYYRIDSVFLYRAFLSNLIPSLIFIILYFIISLIVLFAIFNFVMKKFSLLDYKKSLIVFLIIFFIAVPSIIFIKYEIAKPIANLSVIEKEREDAPIFGLAALIFYKPPLSLRIINSINNSILNKNIINEIQLISLSK